MASVITKGCTKCLQCIENCPVEPFHEDSDTLVIDPKVCIDCGVCVPECPQGIIYAEEDLPRDLKHYAQINLEKSKTLPIILEDR